ncbi:hypothetical protein SSS_00286 [Sarcoptes scabiei]|nr:hypothetical protein SSS_00286 [Sarcoptes scabiei]
MKMIRNNLKFVRLYNRSEGISLIQTKRSLSAKTKLFIDGKFLDSKTNDWIDLHDPATNEVITKVPKSTQDEMNSAVQAAKNAYKTWSQTSVLTRQQTMFKLQNLIQQNNHWSIASLRSKEKQ